MDSNLWDRFDPSARSLILRKVQACVARSAFDKQDHEDLQQELLVRLAEDLRRFDPQKGPLGPFVDLAARSLLGRIYRLQHARKRGSSHVASLDDKAAIHPQPPHEKIADLKNDVQQAMSQLSERDKQFANQLMTKSVAEIARERGIARSTLQRSVERLRRVFEAQGLQIYLR